MPITSAQVAQLTTINLEVNAIPYQALPGPGEEPDWWTDVPEAGDSWVCRDYVLMKADKLRAAGWPASSLTVVLCCTEPVGDPPRREYHAVLAVQVEDETWILDSRIEDRSPARRTFSQSADCRLSNQQRCVISLWKLIHG